MSQSMNENFGAGKLTSRYDRALQFASDAHRAQMRKNGQVPYLSHLLRVSGLVLDYGGSEDVAIAALLHDVVEDCGGLAQLEKIRAEFGDYVADLVLEVSDSTSADPEKKAPWRERKESYIANLAKGSSGAALISGCDKLDNILSITRLLLSKGDRTVLTKFKGGRDGEFWYWDSIVSVLRARKNIVAPELESSLEILKKIWV